MNLFNSALGRMKPPDPTQTTIISNYITNLNKDVVFSNIFAKSRAGDTTPSLR